MMPTPTPENTHPAQCERSARASRGSAHADIPTSTSALASPAAKRQASHAWKSEVVPIASVESATPASPARAAVPGLGLASTHTRAPAR